MKNDLYFDHYTGVYIDEEILKDFIQDSETYPVAIIPCGYLESIGPFEYIRRHIEEV